jgi:hypothetical protein
LGGGSSAEWGTGTNCSNRETAMIVPGIGAPKEGEASVTAETTPHGPPSQSAIMAAQESNAMPTGPRITQAVSKAKVSHRKRPRVMAVIVTRVTCLPRPSPIAGEWRAEIRGRVKKRQPLDRQEAVYLQVVAGAGF